MTWSYKKTEDEIRAALVRQTANMRRSMIAFDQGALEEAERLASAIYIFCHDHGQQVSLFTQIGRKKENIFVDSKRAESTRPGQVILGPPLLANRLVDNQLIYCPAGINDHNKKYVSFIKWWEGEVYKNISGKSLTRKNLILFLRNQDGGGHVDSNLRNEDYYNFVKYADHVSKSIDGSMELLAHLSNISTKNVHWMTVRQIASEVDYVLRELGY